MYHSYLFLHYVPCWKWHPPFTHEILLYFTNRSDGRQVKQPWRRVQMNREERSRYRRSVQHRYHIITKKKLVESNCLSFAPQLYLRLRGQLNKTLRQTSGVLIECDRLLRAKLSFIQLDLKQRDQISLHLFLRRFSTHPSVM